MRKKLWLIPTAFILIISSCELSEEKISTSSELNLLFSTDTVLFDTLLTVRTSITKRFRIYNPSKNAVSISSIRLGRGDDSDYSLIINGRETSHLEDEVLFGGDSLMVLVDLTVDPVQNEDLPYIVKDSVVVEWNSKRTHVKLVAWGQDAIFINQEVICDQTWTADRPYVIYGYALLDSLCTLTVEPGTRIYIENESSLFVKGILMIQGDSANRVLIRNTRFDQDYKQAPGQWEGIVFTRYSKGHTIDYATIENGKVGLRIGSPDDDADFDITISHTIIRNMLYYGVLSFTSDVHMSNSLVYNCGEFLVANFSGGNYSYQHCTFSNWPSQLQVENPAFLAWDHFIDTETNDVTLINDLSVEMKNCIVWGSSDSETDLRATSQANVVLDINSNIIRSDDNFPGNEVSVRDNYPGFKNPFMFDFTLDSLANARDAGIDLGVPDDLLGRPRDSKPDIGAYERIDGN